MDFKMNPDWEDVVRKAAAPAVEKIGNDLQRALAEVSTTYANRPVDEVKVALAAAWAQATPGGSITDPELTQCAEAISRGGRAYLSDGHLMVDSPDE